MSARNHHKRIKMHDEPGDLTIQAKAKLLEDPSNRNAGKSFKNILRKRERAVLKERFSKVDW